MKAASKTATRTLETLRSKAIENGDYVKIDTSETFTPVSVEKLGSYGESEVWAVGHWSEQNGDAMRDPEIVFVRVFGDWYPAEFRNDYLGIMRNLAKFDATTAIMDDGRGKVAYLQVKSYMQRAQRDAASFTTTWMKNIEQQQKLR